MIRAGQLPKGDPNFDEVPYMDEHGFCSICQVRHRANSAIGRDHATAVYWQGKRPLQTMGDFLKGFQFDEEAK